MLTDKWEKISVETDREFAILMAQISKAIFGMTAKEYKEFKTVRTKLRNGLSSNTLVL